MGEQSVTPRVVALANQKGGVGKTTVGLCVAAALAHAGRKVLLVDLDPQASATKALGASLDERDSVYDVLAADPPGGIQSAVQATGWAGVDLAGTTITLGKFERHGGARSAGNEFLLREVLRDHGPLPHDLVLVDCPPQLGLLTTNALTAADALVVVTDPSYMALQGLDDLLDTYTIVRRHLNPDLRFTGVIVNEVARTREHRRRVRELQRHLGDGLLWEPFVPARAAIPEAIAAGTPLHSLRGRAERELASVFDRLAERMLRAV